MGIKGLLQFLRSKAPHTIKTISVQDFSHKSVAIDISLFIYKYKVSYGPAWIEYIINLITYLRSHHIEPLVVFDGKAPVEKQAEQQYRRELRATRLQKHLALIAHLDEYARSGHVHADLYAYADKLKTTKFSSSSSSSSSSDSESEPDLVVTQTSLLKPSLKIYKHPKVRKVVIIEDTPHDDPDLPCPAEYVRNHLTRVLRQNVTFEDGEVHSCKTILHRLHVATFQADTEAEKACVELCKSQYVDAVLTEDTDALAYGTPLFLSKLNMGDHTMTSIHLADVLAALQLTYDQFKDMCIACGCDYNDRITGFGPVSIYKALKLYSTFETIQQEKSQLDWPRLHLERCRELFTTNVRVY